jgi:hypothetical protein
VVSGAVSDTSAAEDTWSGQFPLVSLVLNALRHKWKHPGAGALPPTEYALLTACEFWLALSRDELSAYLGSEPAPRLRYAIAGFSRLGARRVVSVLRIAQQELDLARSPQRVGEIMRLLDARLRLTQDDVEELIARSAGDLVTEDLCPG